MADVCTGNEFCRAIRKIFPGNYCPKRFFCSLISLKCILFYLRVYIKIPIKVLLVKAIALHDSSQPLKCHQIVQKNNFKAWWSTRIIFRLNIYIFFPLIYFLVHSNLSRFGEPDVNLLFTFKFSLVDLHVLQGRFYWWAAWLSLSL